MLMASCARTKITCVIQTNQIRPQIATPLKADADFYLIYLDVWERHITYLEDERFPSIREVALGGMDSATRAKIVWQVKAWTGKPAPNMDTDWKTG
jgi:hypothetical protein